MNREDIQKLLGGYATGTLTPEEQETLFAAALEDQELFDALGREQALRDLLRDPAAKVELLAALERPVRGGFWTWLSRPLVVGVAAAGVAAIAVLALWTGTRLRPPAAAIVAQVAAPERKPLEMPAKEVKATESAPAPAGVRAKRRATPQPSASLERQLDQAVAVSPEKLKKEMSPAMPAAAPPPPPPPAPAAAAAAGQSVAESVAVQADAAPVPQPRFQAMNAPTDKLTLDARALFYGNSFAPRKDAVAPGGVAGGAPPPSAPRFSNTRAVSGNLAKSVAAATSLGVRVSILRGTQEAAVTTVLDPGESVRLKLTPNQDGFLYVAARDGTGWKMVASGPAQRLVSFETPPLPFQGSGQKQVYVMLSRQAQTLSPQSLAGLVRANLVEAAAEPDRATYVVAGQENAPPVQVVQPITLMYR